MKLIILMFTAQSLLSLFHHLSGMCSRNTLPKTEVLMVLEKWDSDGIKGVGSTKACVGSALKPSGADFPVELEHGCTNPLDVSRNSHGRVGAVTVTVVKINLEDEDEIHS